MNFRRYSSAVSPPRIAVSSASVKATLSTTTLTWYFREPLPDATWLGLDLDEAGFGARGNLAGKLYSVTHGLF